LDVEGVHDVFVMVIIFLKYDWRPKHVTLGLFEVLETIGHALAKK
jgi:hypothetical protein